jgi:catalase
VSELAEERDAIDWICEAHRHCKPIAASGEGAELLRGWAGLEDPDDDGVLLSEDADANFATQFVAAIAQHRFWERTGKNRLGSRAGVDRETRGHRPEPRAAAALEAP